MIETAEDKDKVKNSTVFKVCRKMLGKTYTYLHDAALYVANGDA